MYTNSKTQMHVSNSSAYRITTSNAHTVKNARFKSALKKLEKKKK